MDYTELAWAAALGVILGVIFFAGLYLTVVMLPRLRNKGGGLVLSAVVRLAIVVAGFYYIGAGSWTRMIAALAGFVVARQILLATLGRKIQPKMEKSHETQ